MAYLGRIRAEWTGSSVTGGGLSTFYTSVIAPSGADLTDARASVASFFTELQGVTGNTTTTFVPKSGDVVDIDTGEIAGGWTAGGVPGQNLAESTGAYAQGVGARIVWTTNGIHKRRRVRGGTFVVPLAGAMYDSDGTLTPTCVNRLTTAAQFLLGPIQFQIWSRPSPGGSGGMAFPITGFTVPDRVSWLRSRRT